LLSRQGADQTNQIAALNNTAREQTNQIAALNTSAREQTNQIAEQTNQITYLIAQNRQTLALFGTREESQPSNAATYANANASVADSDDGNDGNGDGEDSEANDQNRDNVAQRVAKRRRRQ
jgi:hypothetical protein